MKVLGGRHRRSRRKKEAGDNSIKANSARRKMGQIMCIATMALAPILLSSQFNFEHDMRTRFVVEGPSSLFAPLSSSNNDNNHKANDLGYLAQAQRSIQDNNYNNRTSSDQSQHHHHPLDVVSRRRDKSWEYETYVTNINNQHHSTSGNNATTTSSGGEVVVFVCDGHYAEAVISSIVSLRTDGNYHGNVAVVLAATTENVTRSFLLQRLDVEMKMDHNSNVWVYTVEELMNVLYLDIEHHSPDDNRDNSNQTKLNDLLRIAPSASSCSERTGRLPAYYRKLLLYHPTIALQWDTVLYMDACMTFHLPLVDKIFEISRIQHPQKVLAALDLWQWRSQGLLSQLLSKSKGFRQGFRHGCSVNEEGEALLRHIVKHSQRVLPSQSSRAASTTQQPSADILGEASYFNSAFILVDTSVVRSYRRVTGTSASTIVEMMQLFHHFAHVFKGGDQEIQSVYWMYLRDASEFSVLPNHIWSLDNNAVMPYSFTPPLVTAHPSASWNGDVAKRTPMPIITAFNTKREVCASRSVNAGFKKRAGYVPL